jgi:glutamyl-tRNA(Gln) amidotransferase subunit D
MVPDYIDKNYQGDASVWLQEHGIKVWSHIIVKTTKGTFKGILLPRGEQGDDQHLVLKLTNGYNIGINIKNIESITAREQIEPKYEIPERKVEKESDKPRVVLLGTGGTVASKLDYRTGAVKPAFSTQELYNAVPELESICDLETKTVTQIFSENILPEDWIQIGNEVIKKIEQLNPAGIVITHGTDTMHYTSAALSFMLKNIDRPIVLVGAQRSSDRPSSDAAINLINGVQIATESDIAEVVVCMHGTSGEGYNLIHRGTRVRKMHTSRRDAFRTISGSPIAKIKNGKITYTGISYTKKSSIRKPIEIDANINEKVALIYDYPGMQSEIIDFYIDQKFSGIVIAGTGLGHINQRHIKAIERAKEDNIPVFMTSQCIWGHTGMNVYETGRLLQKAGIVPLGNMLPEVALVKAMWVLGHTSDLKFAQELMQKNLAGEITKREEFDEYPLFQPKVDKRLNKLLSDPKK